MESWEMSCARAQPNGTPWSHDLPLPNVGQATPLREMTSAWPMEGDAFLGPPWAPPGMPVSGKNARNGSRLWGGAGKKKQAVNGSALNPSLHVSK